MWKFEDEDRPEKPRRYGLTEMRGPQFTLSTQTAIQDILESHGDFVDGLKFSGGSHSLFPKDFIKQLIDMAHKHSVYVSTGDWAQHHYLSQPSSFKTYVHECKQLGFDAIDINASSLNVPDESLFAFVREIKNGGLRAKPLFAVKFDKSDLPLANNRAFGAYIAPLPTNSSSSSSSERVEDVDLMLRRAERCVEAGADIIMIDADDVCKYAESLRTDIIAKIVSRLGLERTMFEASNLKTSEWFVRRYGPRVNLFVDYSHVMNLECLRGHKFGPTGYIG